MTAVQTTKTSPIIYKFSPSEALLQKKSISSQIGTIVSKVLRNVGSSIRCIRSCVWAYFTGAKEREEIIKKIQFIKKRDATDNNDQISYSADALNSRINLIYRNFYQGKKNRVSSTAIQREQIERSIRDPVYNYLYNSSQKKWSKVSKRS